MHNGVLKQDLTSSVILHTLVTLLFRSFAVYIIFVRALLSVPHRHVCLLKRRIAGKKMRKREKWACIRQNSVVHEYKFILSLTVFAELTYIFLFFSLDPIKLDLNILLQVLNIHN